MMNFNNYKLNLREIYFLATLLASAWHCAAEAQTAPEQQTPVQANADADVTVLEPIVVTARRIGGHKRLLSREGNVRYPGQSQFPLLALRE
ncbi:MAG: hypothetical protein OJJ21_00715 [Ferrovibrio sp.]|uniref:hypothetical protein n=1 Tax=Ferrovibrio sp. TaxID=1917215 RepID=UPI0026239E12|nr:hypothetical protein [Ferrovibrio sp.]MCW0232100.1 hypothetical protein [Ferrovibrio sp.]